MIAPMWHAGRFYLLQDWLCQLRQLLSRPRLLDIVFSSTHQLWVHFARALVTSTLDRSYLGERGFDSRLSAFALGDLSVLSKAADDVLDAHERTADKQCSRIPNSKFSTQCWSTTSDVPKYSASSAI
jgi:hypothetical protein